MQQNDDYNEIRNLLFTKLQLKKRSNISLRMTPMIDMIFLLLVFFLVTAKFRPQEDLLPMQLPAPDTAVAAADILVDPLIISLSTKIDHLRIDIDNSKTFKIPDGDPDAALATFASEILSLYSAQNRVATDPVELDCDENLSWKHLVKVYNVLFGMGMTDITFPLTE